MTKYVIAKYAAELRFEPSKGDVVEAAYGEPIKYFESLEAAEAAIKENWYILSAEPRTGNAGKYWESDEYALEEWEYDDDGEFDQGRVIRILG